MNISLGLVILGSGLIALSGIITKNPGTIVASLCVMVANIILFSTR